MSKAVDSQTTVYSRNTREGVSARQCEAGWHPSIARLVERDYAFLPVAYGGAGMLYRGLDRGLGAVLTDRQLGLNEGGHSLAQLEREAGVLFVSADLSDALAVSRLWSNHEDAAIFAIPASQFAAAHAAGNAAVLGFADPGVVFRYPCFAPPLALSTVTGVIVHPAAFETARAQAGEFADRVRTVPLSGAAVERADFERQLSDWCAGQQYSRATEVPDAAKPRIVSRVNRAARLSERE